MDADGWRQAMSTRTQTVGRGFRGSQKMRQLVMALMIGCCISANAATEAQGATSESTGRRVSHHHNGHSLEERVGILTQWLKLDAKQQSEVRKVLDSQREQIKSLWSDTSVPAAYRISATQTISDKTGDQIRALLNEDQRKKFNPPRQPRDETGSAKPNVEDWMDAAKPK
jgi:hypothetical protein